VRSSTETSVLGTIGFTEKFPKWDMPVRTAARTESQFRFDPIAQAQ
jgi:hypothetical protein